MEDLIGRVNALLASSTFVSPNTLHSAVSYLEEIRAPLLKLRTEIQRELLEKREQLRMPNYPPDSKDKSTPRYTDFDRRTMLDAATAEINERYELVKGLEDLVKERVELIKVLLEAK